MSYISNINNLYTNFNTINTDNIQNVDVHHVEKQKKNIVAKSKNIFRFLLNSNFKIKNKFLPPCIRNINKKQKNTNRKAKVLEVCVDNYGFFRTTDDDKRLFITHDDTFHLDKKNNLVTSRGYYIEGFDADKINSTEIPTPINFSKYMSIPGKATDIISIKTELNSNTMIKPFIPFDMFNPRSYNAIIPIFGYDIDGKKYSIQLFCVRKSVNKWEIRPSLTNHRIFNKSFTVEFDKNGNIISKPSYYNIAFHKLGYPDTQSMIIDLKRLTSKRMTSPYVRTKVEFSQNGQRSYDLKDLEVNHAGLISGIYETDIKKPLKQLILIRLKNIKKVEYRGGYFWEVPKDKISPDNQIISLPGQREFGKILNKNSREYEEYHARQLQIGREMRRQQEYGL